MYSLKFLQRNAISANLSKCISNQYNLSLKPKLVSTGNDNAAANQTEVAERMHGQISEIKKVPGREPFVKRLFVGECDIDMLPFPQILKKDRYDLLHAMLDPIKKFYKDEVDSSQIDRDASIPQSVLDGLKNLGLYGMQIPEEYEGLGLSATELARLMEIISLDGSIAVTLMAHQGIGLKGILLAGTEEQKRHYLPRLASGELTAAFCLTEAGSGSDAASVQTIASASPDGKYFFISGEKIWISNGGTADIMTVFARTKVLSEDGSINDKVSAFIVERGFGGITNGKPEDKLGIRGSNTCSIHFDNTPVPKENLLGDLGEGFKLAVNILNSGRFCMGSSLAGVLKDLMERTVEHANTRKQFGQNLSEFAIVKEKLGNMAVDTYVMESMAYFTAGLIDTYEGQDCSIESAIVKVYSSEAIWKHSSEALQLMGGHGYMKGAPFERILRDNRIAQIFEGTNEILRLFIALSGLQFAGKKMQELVIKLRNPLLNPHFTFKQSFRQMFYNIKRPHMDLRMPDYLHPSLSLQATSLEFCIKSFQLAIEHLFSRHGKKVTKAEVQLDLVRVANIAIDLYAMTCVLSRASRSYSVGIHNNDHEVDIACLFVFRARKRIEKEIEEIIIGNYENFDEKILTIANDVISKKGHAAEHPLTRTIW